MYPIVLIFLVISISSVFGSDVYGLQSSLSPIINLLDDFLILIFGGYCLFQPKNSDIKRIFVIFILLAIVSSAYNSTSIQDFLQFITRYGKIFFLTAIGKSISKITTIDHIVSVTTIFNLLNLVLNTLWYFEISLLQNKYLGTVDFAVGVFGDALYQAFFSSIVIILNLLVLYDKKIISKTKIFTIITAAIQLIFSFTFHYYFVFLFALIIALISFYDFEFKKVFIISLSGIGFFLLITQLPIINSYLPKINNSNSFFSSIQALTIISPKAQSYKNAFSGEYQNGLQQFVGVGPGQGGSFISLNNKTRIAENYFNIYLYFSEKLRAEGSITTLPNTGIITLKSELGYLGLILFIYFLSFIILNLKKNKNNIYAFLGIFCIYLFILENVLADYLQHSLIPILTFILSGYGFSKK